MTLKIDYSYIHDKKCEYFSYLKNFLNKGAPEEQISEELTLLIQDVAFHTAKKAKEDNRDG